MLWKRKFNPSINSHLSDRSLASPFANVALCILRAL
jgi:hypothetical protein